MSDMINIGSLQADLDVNTTKLERGIANAERALFLIRQDIKAAQDAFRQGQIAIQEYADRLAYLTESENKLIAAMAAATNAVNNNNNSLNNAGSRAAAAGMALMQLGYVIDDIQYGFQGVVNNIGPFVYQISTLAGASQTTAMGVGSAAQILGVATYQIIAHWSQLMDAFGVGIPNAPVEGLKELQKELKATNKVIEDLSKKPRLTLQEKTDLDQARAKTATLEKEIKARQEIERITGQQSKEERERGSAFKDAVAEIGGDKALGELEAAMMAKADKEGVTLDPAQIRELAKRKGVDMTDAQVRAAAQRKYLIDPETGEARLPETVARDEMIRASSGSKDARSRIQNALDDVAGGALKSAFSRKIDDLSPETAANEKEKARFIKENDDRAKEEAARQEKARKDRERAVNEEQDFHENARNVFKQAVGTAKKMVPGADSMAEFATMQGMLGGNPRAASAVRAQIQAELEKQGINKGVASAAADEMLKDADKKVKGNIIDEMFKEGEQPKATRSQQFDASELAARVQAGVGGNDEPKKQTNLMKRMVTLLANIEKAKNGILGVE